MDVCLIFLGRIVRHFSYGMVTLVLFFHLIELGFSALQAASIFTCTLVGDLLWLLSLARCTDAFGRKTTLLLGAVLVTVVFLSFAHFSSFWLLSLASVSGVVTPTGGETGPFLAVEQAALTQLSGGLTQQVAHRLASGMSRLDTYRQVFFILALCGFLSIILALSLSNRIEATDRPERYTKRRGCRGRMALKHAISRQVMRKLSVLFVVDSFAGGFVLPTLLVFWLQQRFGLQESLLGKILCAASVLAGLSTQAVGPLVVRVGLLVLMCSQLPASLLLLLLPFMSTSFSVLALLLARALISEMYYPAGQAYVALMVNPEDRDAAAGLLKLVRGLGRAGSPALAIYLFRASPTSYVFILPFLIAGGLKTVSDMLVWCWCVFRDARPSSIGILPTTERTPLYFFLRV
eukprot:gb/GEZN01006800.1/.p1 GENE.gb/GEZN01006800.1/~~gb/GEZN01006800.1/.p1  ORF type:complete len:405 (-),score=53.39 gb/GEZN01006800.1/:343-1557(-)